jgi:hypothetical protein
VVLHGTGVDPHSAGRSSNANPSYVAVDMPPDASMPPPSARAGSSSLTSYGSPSAASSYSTAAVGAVCRVANSSSTSPAVVDAVPGGYGIPESRFSSSHDDTLGPNDQAYARVAISTAYAAKVSANTTTAAAGGVREATGKAEGKGAGGIATAMGDTGAAGGSKADLVGPTPAQMSRNRRCRTACAVVLVVIVLLLATGLGVGLALYLKPKPDPTPPSPSPTPSSSPSPPIPSPSPSPFPGGGEPEWEIP